MTISRGTLDKIEESRTAGTGTGAWGRAAREYRREGVRGWKRTAQS